MPDPRNGKTTLSIVCKCQGTGLEPRSELKPLEWICEDLARGTVSLQREIFLRFQ